jgi:diguanylate cyclase (GGDEF)-like protein
MDIHTLHVEHTVLLAVYTLLTMVNARMHKGIRGIHWFSLYNALLFVGALLVALRGQMPDAPSIVGGNMFVVAGYVALFVSLAKFFGARLSQVYIHLALFAIALAAMLQYGWLHPETNKRLIAYSIVLFAQQAHIALFTARKERRHTHAAASMSVMLGALAAMNLLRICTIFIHGVPQNYLSVHGSLVWMVLVNTCLQCGAIVSYVWMSASLLRGDLALQASTDHLTGLLNRRAMERAAEQVLAMASTARPASAIVIDLNDFKSINDTHGHSCGDAVLTAVARALELGLRHSDFLGRMGGDEFVALLPATPVAAAREIAAALDLGIRSIRVPAGQAEITVPAGQTEITVSASFGCAQAEDPATDWGHLLVECDKLLYAAKQARPLEDTPLSADVDSLRSQPI